MFDFAFSRAPSPDRGRVTGATGSALTRDRVCHKREHVRELQTDIRSITTVKYRPNNVVRRYHIKNNGPMDDQGAFRGTLYVAVRAGRGRPFDPSGSKCDAAAVQVSETEVRNS